MEHTLKPNKPPKFPGYYFFVNLRNGVLDIVSVFEGYREKKVLLYAFINDERIYTEDELSNELHFYHAHISIPEKLINASSSYKRFLNAKKDVKETQDNSEFKLGQKVKVWDYDSSKKHIAFYAGKNNDSYEYRYLAKMEGSVQIFAWIHCEAYDCEED